MSGCCTPKGYRQIFSEKNARGEAKRYRRKGLDGTSRRIADLLREGVVRAVNVELTPTYEAAAGELLQETGLADRVERKVMDFAKAGSEVEPADFVVMNRVTCCYPDMPKLAGTAPDTRGILVMSFPNDRWWTRFGLAVVNLGFRIIRMQFRVFLHPPELILAVVERHGFRTRLNERGLLCQVTALERTA